MISVRSPATRRIDPDRSPTKSSPFRSEGNAARDAEVGRDDLRPPARVYLVDAAVEPAGDVQTAVAVEGHRRRVRQVAHERHARAVGADLVDRHRRLLAPRPAEGHIEVARQSRRPGCRPGAVRWRAVRPTSTKAVSPAAPSTRIGVWPPSSPAGTIAVSAETRRRPAATGVPPIVTSGGSGIDAKSARREW